MKTSTEICKVCNRPKYSLTGNPECRCLSPIPIGNWLRNPDYDASGFTVELSCGDHVLVAVPLHKDSGGGFEIEVIVPTETGFDDVHGDSWGSWDWSDVEFYAVVRPPT